jgi:hypothetical protein
MACYTICDLRNGSGTFCKITKEAYLHNNSMITFVENGFVATAEMLDASPSLQIKFVQGPLEGKVYNFSSKDVPIRIGRTEECNI